MPTIEAGPASPARPFSAAGGPQFRLGLGFFLVGCPDLLTRLGLLGRNALHLGCDAVERTRQAHRLTLRLVRTGLPRLREHGLCILEALREGGVDLLVS